MDSDNDEGGDCCCCCCCVGDSLVVVAGTVVRNPNDSTDADYEDDADDCKVLP